ncbi:FAD-binding oxidoreductase [Thalassospira sp. MCCC 1A02491]|uniref:NAD(P)/FAD-dependent oxidoreductase n=1 Tax=Thalassospira sp. MCCC 1A02491 TaxID=1769751 RepID=UPI0007AD6F12|nr:FAD-binding oxidoreductase [Thalassospira sp. MCCC 1A02491]KZB68896.1 FAD-dependent oxidoreductase [Thalassospira sp. MCCC 1A02491]
MTHSDILIIGGGIAGMSAAYFLAKAGKSVTVLEREDQPGYHSTGRSAALYSETYGPKIIRKMSTASRDFFLNPPAGFTENPILTPRGIIMYAGPGEEAELDALISEGRANGANFTELTPDALKEIVPILNTDLIAKGAHEPDAMDIDVHALHWGFIRQFKAVGGNLVIKADVSAIAKAGDNWQVTLANGDVHSGAILVNAAGAWADDIATKAGVKPLGIVPKRRTAVMVDAPDGMDIHGLPMVAALDESLYFKEDAGRLLVSPADKTPTEPHDVQPEELDIAIAIDRLMTATSVVVRRPGESWAGLRSFFADGDPVSSFDPQDDSFYWLAGQGGYGIQTAPAMGEYAASLICGNGIPAHMEKLGVSEDALSASRPTLASGK